MERVRRIGEARRQVAAGLGFVEMRVEHDVRTTPGGPADRFRIAPAFMADRDTKRQRAGLENAPPDPGEDAILGRVELDFVLKTGDSSVAIDDQCGDAAAIDDTLGAENNGEVAAGGRGEGDQARSRKAGREAEPAFPIPR